MYDLNSLGSGWLADEIENLTDALGHIAPSDFNEQTRYLPDSVTPLPGFIRFDINPYMREILDCCDPRSDVREVNLKKGVQTTYTTLLESVLFYYIAYIKTRPVMMVSADKELVKGRIENYILPMLNQSECGHLIKTADEGNFRKTGKTANHLQWEGGGFLVPAGANKADKMRMWSIMLMLKDEIDAWAERVGKDGDPDSLTDDRCSAFWDIRKIYRGGTPLIKGSSKIQYQYERGDQRKYMVLCRFCSFPQEIRWSTINKDNGIVGGFKWDMEGGVLQLDSVRYLCSNCGHGHYEYDKTKLFSAEDGAHWLPTATPVERGIRSYHLPAMYSPVGLQPWSKCVSAYLKGWDHIGNRVLDVGKYQVFYNNVLGEPFEIIGSRVRFSSVSSHRRTVYKFGQIPNNYAKEYSFSPILFLTCQVDVHKKTLFVSVMGWTHGCRSYLINYDKYEVGEGEEDCTSLQSPVWQKLRYLIEEKIYISEDGTQYRVALTFIDAGYSNDTVTTFCGDYTSGVYPILGRDRPSKNQTIKEFAEFKTQSGKVGYRITVDHYKDRMASILRRDWHEDQGQQSEHHFNAPVDTTDKQLKEMIAETRREKKDANGKVTYEWHRPGNVPNELGDLWCYGNAAVEIFAHNLCIQCFEMETVEWNNFWQFCQLKENDKIFARESVNE